MQGADWQQNCAGARGCADIAAAEFVQSSPNPPTKWNARRMTAEINKSVAKLAESQIRQIMEMGQGMEGVIPLWFGEGDEATPEFIKQAAVQALSEDKTFYVPNNGVPELRQAIAEYMSRLYGRPVAVERITAGIRSSGKVPLRKCSSITGMIRSVTKARVISRTMRSSSFKRAPTSKKSRASNPAMIECLPGAAIT